MEFGQRSGDNGQLHFIAARTCANASAIGIVFMASRQCGTLVRGERQCAFFEEFKCRIHAGLAQ